MIPHAEPSQEALESIQDSGGILGYTPAPKNALEDASTVSSVEVSGNGGGEVGLTEPLPLKFSVSGQAFALKSWTHYHVGGRVGFNVNPKGSIAIFVHLASVASLADAEKFSSEHFDEAMRRLGWMQIPQSEVAK